MLDVLCFLWALPAPLGQSFFAFRNMDVPKAFPWDAPDIERALLLLKVIDRAPPAQRASFLMDLREANVLADEAGYEAILNACHPDHDLAATLQAMPGYAERALWTLWSHWSVLDHALAIRQLDETLLAHRSQRVVVPWAPRPSDDAAAYDAFAAEVEQEFRWRERTDEQSVMTVARRHRDRAIQFVLHVDHPVDLYEPFPLDGTHPSCVRPMVRLAVIYYENTGVLETIVSSGKPYHAMLREAFQQHVLGNDARVREDELRPLMTYRMRREAAILHDANPALPPKSLSLPATPAAPPPSATVEIATDGRWLRVHGRELRLKGKQRDFALVMTEAYRSGLKSPTLEWVLRKAGYGEGTTQLRHVSKSPEFFDFFGYGDGEVWIRTGDDLTGLSVESAYPVHRHL